MSKMIKVLVEYRMDDIDDREEAEKRVNFSWQCRDANIRISAMKIIKTDDMYIECICQQCGISYPIFNFAEGCPQCGHQQPHTQALELLEVMKKDV